MSMIRQFVKTAETDMPVYISDVRDAFQKEGERPFHIHAVLYDGSIRRFTLLLPDCDGTEEEAFAEEYLNATLYNVLSALGAREIRIFIDPEDIALAAYTAKLGDIFQVDVPIASRTGYGKCLNVNQRVLESLVGADAHFRFIIDSIDREDVKTADAPVSMGQPAFAALPARAGQGCFMGMDVGGTDIKAAASVDSRLCAVKEYDWNPSVFTRAEQLTGPMMMLTRLMRAAAGMTKAGLSDELPLHAFEKTAGDAEVEAAAAAMEYSHP